MNDEEKFFEATMTATFHFYTDNQETADGQWEKVIDRFTSWVNDLQDDSMVGNVLSAFTPNTETKG